MSQSWYRNCGSKIYHAAESGWIRTGRAICGRDIRRPGYVADSVAEVLQSLRAEPCKACLRKVLRDAVAAYRRTGYVVARDYLESVARAHGLTVQQALDRFKVGG